MRHSSIRPLNLDTMSGYVEDTSWNSLGLCRNVKDGRLSGHVIVWLSIQSFDAFG